jgi:hypothetical protein
MTSRVNGDNYILHQIFSVGGTAAVVDQLRFIVAAQVPAQMIEECSIRRRVPRLAGNHKPSQLGFMGCHLRSLLLLIRNSGGFGYITATKN